MRRLNLFISGQKYFGQEVLRLCLELDYKITGVCAPLGDGKPDRLHKLAYKEMIPIIPSGTLRADNLPDNTDLIIAAHSFDYNGQKTRLKSRLGAIGYHPSLLPRHRGRDAVEWAVRMKDPITGGSVYWLDNGVDTGPVAAQDWCWVHPGDDSRELWRRDLQPMGLRLIKKVLLDLSGGVIVAVPQDEGVATWEPSIGRPPLFRPELPQIGAVSGYAVIKTQAQIGQYTLSKHQNY